MNHGTRGLAIALAVLGVVMIGGAVPRRMSDGVGRIADPVERRVAGDAVELASMTCLENPIAYALTPTVRVAEVRRDAGSCVAGPAPEGAVADYVVELRALGPFGIPLRTFTATCGGNHVTC